MIAPMVERTDDQLHLALGSLFADLCRTHRDILAIVAEQDRRETWRAWGAVGEDSYLVSQLALGRRTARDWVKVAHALERNWALAGSFTAGEVSFDQLVPLVEVMAHQRPGSTDPLGPFDDPDGSEGAGSDGEPTEGGGEGPDPGGASDSGTGSGAGDSDADPTGDASDGGGAGGQNPLDLAGRLSAAQLLAMARGLRRRSEAEVAAAHRRRRARVIDIDGGAGLHLESDLFDDAAAAVRVALDEYVRGLDPDPETGRYEPVEQSYADALAEMALAWLDGREHHSGRPALIVHADAEVLAGGDGWAETPFGALAAETVRRLSCWCHLTGCEDGPDGDPLRLGRTQRTPTWQLAEMVRRRDRGCRFPGCRRTRWSHTHHVRWWDAQKGPTDFENLCMLCRRHHRLVHEGGWRLTGDPCAELTFTSPTGLVLTSWPDQASRSATGPPGAGSPDRGAGPPGGGAGPPDRGARPPGRDGPPDDDGRRRRGDDTPAAGCVTQQSLLV